MQGDFPLHSFTFSYNGKKKFKYQDFVKVQQMIKNFVLTGKTEKHYFCTPGTLAQLVQSAALTEQRSLVRAQYVPQLKIEDQILRGLKICIYIAVMRMNLQYNHCCCCPCRVNGCIGGGYM
jgi:hypothetical protein